MHKNKQEISFLKVVPSSNTVIDLETTDQPSPQSSSALRGARSHRKRGRPKASQRKPDQISRDQERLQASNATKAKNPIRPRKRTSAESFEAARQEYQENPDCSMRSLSQKYGIPRMTLTRRLSGSSSGVLGRPYVLSEELERDLANAICAWCQKGATMHLEEFTKIAAAYAKERTGKSTFKASSTWTKKFIQRWELCEWEDGNSKVLGMHRRISCSEHIVSQFIEELFIAFDAYLKSLSEELNINTPDLSNEEIAAGIFGLDETSLSNKTPTKFEPVKLTPKSGKNSIQVMQSICSGQSTISATLLELFCADGTAPFSFMTTKQSFQPEQEEVLRNILTPQTKLDFCYLESGKFNSNTHAQFLELIGNLRKGLPSLVIQDCPAFHKTDAVLEAAQKANIYLLGLPSNSSWWLQQADDLPFLLTKNEHYRRVKQFTLDNHKSPDLFETCKIFLESRQKVLTSEVIISSFRRVGQYDSELKSPSKRAILAKARNARLRCSSSETWIETDELRLSMHEEIQKEIESIDQSLEDSLDSLKRIKNTILQNRSASRVPQITPQLANVIAKEREVQKMRADVDALAVELALAQARESIQSRASLPIPDDPDIVIRWMDLRETCNVNDLPFLRQQLVLLQSHIELLKTAAKEAKNTEAGKLLQKGKDEIGLPLQVSYRKEIKKELENIIQRLSAEEKNSSQLKRSCLYASCQSKSRKNTTWTPCAHCGRGYCKKCQKNNSITQHEAACLDLRPLNPTSIEQSTFSSDDTQAHQTTDEFEEFLAQIDSQQEDHVEELPTPQFGASNQTDAGVLLVDSVDAARIENDDDLETQTNSEILEVTEDLTRIRLLLARVSRHKTVSMITKTPFLEIDDSSAQIELRQDSNLAPQNIIEAAEAPRNPIPVKACMTCGSIRQLYPCLNGHLLCRSCRGSCPLCSSRKRIAKRLEWPYS